jgi:hypothetical protein
MSPQACIASSPSLRLKLDRSIGSDCSAIATLPVVQRAPRVDALEREPDELHRLEES